MAAAADGRLVYVPGGDAARGKPAWIDRADGGVEFLPLEEQLYGQVDLSPDGRSVAVQVLDVLDYILIHDIGGAQTLLQGQNHYRMPLWSRSDHRLAYTTLDPEGARFRVLTQVPNSGRPPDVLTEGQPVGMVAVAGWLDDSRLVVLQTLPHVATVESLGDTGGPTPSRCHPGSRPAATMSSSWVSTMAADG